MKKKRIVFIASLVHLILWGILLLVSVIEQQTFYAPEMEPLAFAMKKGILTVFSIISAVGIITAAVLFLSLCAISSQRNTRCKGRRITALCFSATATILFYSTIVLLFTIDKDILFILPIMWLLCELCCGILLVCSVKKE
ncbi:MAG: hypothetical protein E7454_06070 [Ruminococcaceae bacterium]|nr:hypothetical protein [Oscillospiraceae bacterium]